MESRKFKVPRIEEDGHMYAVDEFGFYVISDDQLNAQQAGVEALQWDATESCWWRAAIRAFDVLCEGESCSASGSVDSHVPLQALREKLLKGMRARINRTAGYPSCRLRRLIWPFFTGVLRGPKPYAYRSLLACPVPEETVELIHRDLPRTFPTHCLFLEEDSIGQQALRRVLQAYCVLDSEVGYCQGMGFIVAVLLLHLSEEGAFWVFVQMMQGKQFMMRQLYITGFPLLQQFFVLLRRLTRKLLPLLSSHFEEINVDVSFFAAQWFLTLFAYQLSVPLVSCIWDLFFSSGWKAIFQVAIALLQWDQHLLIHMKMEEILLHLKNVHEGKKPNEVLRHTLDVPIILSDLDIEKVL